ncbi:MAG: hypothetical protein ABIA76_02300 [Candidatus Diapherotrites archaeon]
MKKKALIVLALILVSLNAFADELDPCTGIPTGKDAFFQWATTGDTPELEKYQPPPPNLAPIYYYRIVVGQEDVSGSPPYSSHGYAYDIVIESHGLTQGEDFTAKCLPIWAICYYLGYCKPEERIEVKLNLTNAPKLDTQLNYTATIYNYSLQELTQVSSGDLQITLKKGKETPKSIACSEVQSAYTIPIGGNQLFNCVISGTELSTEGKHTLTVLYNNQATGLTGSDYELFYLMPEFQNITIPEVNEFMVLIVLISVLFIVSASNSKK